MPRDLEMLERWKPEPITDDQARCVAGIEAGDYEAIRHKMELVAWEAYQMLSRMGISPMIKGGDACVGVYTAKGDLATAVMGTQLHLINSQIAVKYTIKYFVEDETVGVREGDMFYVNDVLSGGLHNPDQILYMPIFWGGELVAWCAAASHETETGAKEPGGLPPSAESRYDEGMKLSPIKIGEGYKLRTDIMEMMENMVRDPRMQTLDIKARAAACHTVERRLHEVLADRGRDFLVGVLRKMVDESKAAGRKKLAELPDGVFRHTLFMDSIGTNKFGLIKAVVEVEKRGDHAMLRFSGSPRVVGGNFNVFPHMQIAMTACYFFQFLFWELPPSIGVYDAVDFEFQEGSFFRADPDDATGLGVATISCVIAGVHTCFEKMKFASPYHDFVISPWPGTPTACAHAGMNLDGHVFAGWDQGQPNGNGCGARWDRDGLDAAGFVFCAIGEYIDSEQFEEDYPLLPLYRSRFWKDGHGFGKQRGGRSMHVAWRVHHVDETVALSLSGFSFRPISGGLYGGYPNRPNGIVFVTDNDWEQVAADGRAPTDFGELMTEVHGEVSAEHVYGSPHVLKRGDIVAAFTPSGPGYGDVLERDPQDVMRDLKEESISDFTAREVYRVVYDPQTFVVDEDATAAARDAERRDRLRRSKPTPEFLEEWLTQRPPDHVLEYYGSWPEGLPPA